jgi:predicted homoserine dehydrogenase-like protein
VIAVAKRELQPGDVIRRGIGGFDVRGEAIRAAECANLVDVALATGARARRRIATGEPVARDSLLLTQEAYDVGARSMNFGEIELRKNA